MGRPTDNTENNKKRTEAIYNSSYSYKPRPAQVEQSIKMRKAKSTKKSVILAVFLFIAAAVALTLVVCFFFNVETVTIEGNVYYKTEDIVEKSGITVGDNMYAISKSDVRDGILSKLNGIEDVKVTRILPSEIVITVTEHIPSMYVAVGDSYYILSSNMRVLRSTTDIDSIESAGLVRIYTPDVTGCIAGERIVTADGDVTNLVEELYASLCSLSMNEYTDGINFTDKFNISLEYDGKYTVKLGNALRLHEKLSMAKQMIEKSEEKRGTIDVSDDDVTRGIHTWE